MEEEAVPVLEPSGADGADDSGPTRQLRFGEKVALDDLGPIIVNEDCTMRRIENWREMTERERRGTQKRIAERNALRLGNCRDRYAKAGIWRDAYSDLGDVERAVGGIRERERTRRALTRSTVS